MPQGPGTYGNQVGRPKKKDKMVDPKKQQTSNVAPPPAPQKQGFRPNPTDRMGRPVIEDKAEREKAIESEVDMRMTPEGIHSTNQQLEQEGFLEKGSADRMRRTQRDFDAAQKQGAPITTDEKYLNPQQQAQARFMDNRAYEEEQAQARQKQEEADAKVMDERMAALEDKKFQKYMSDKEEYEISGFDGSMKEWEQDRSNRARYQRGIDDLSIDRDMSFEDWEAQDYSDRRAKKQARDARLEEERGVRRQEKEEQRVSERERHLGERDALRSRVEARREARNRGLERGTEEYQQFMDRETSGGMEAQREQDLAMERAKAGDTIEVAKLGLEGTEATIEGQVTMQGMINSSNETIAAMSKEEHENLAKWANQNNIDMQTLTNMSAKELAEIQAQMTKDVTEMTETGTTDRTRLQQTSETDRTRLEQTGETDRTRLTTKSAEAMNNASIAANQALAELQNDTALKQIEQTGWLANKQLDNDAFNKQMEMAFAAANTNAERLAQFGIANGQFMTPEQNEMFQARLMQMDGGEEALSKIFAPGSDTNVLGQTQQQMADEEARTAEDKELQSRMVGDIEFTTAKEAKDFNDSSFKFMNDKDGNMSPLVTLLEDVDDFTNLDLPDNAARKEQFIGAVNDLSNVVNQLIAMPQDQMMKAADLLLTQTGVEQLQEGAIADQIHVRSSSSKNIRLAKRGFLQFLYQAKAGRRDLPSDWQTGIDGLGLGIQPITP